MGNGWGQREVGAGGMRDEGPILSQGRRGGASGQEMRPQWPREARGRWHGESRPRAPKVRRPRQAGSSSRPLCRPSTLPLLPHRPCPPESPTAAKGKGPQTPFPTTLPAWGATHKDWTSPGCASTTSISRSTGSVAILCRLGLFAARTGRRQGKHILSWASGCACASRRSRTWS